jgi:hypothetical protein
VKKLISPLFIIFVLAGCETAQQKEFEKQQAESDAKAAAFQQQEEEDSSHVAEKAANLQKGMNKQAVESTLNWPLTMVSSTTNGETKLDQYKTDVTNGFPNVWLTFFNGALDSWTIVPQN